MPAARIRSSGFTLFELIVVAGVLAVLLGLGVGYLGNSSGAAEATAAIGAQLRAAALQARSRGLPTETTVAPGRDGGNATVRTRGLEPLAVFSFEPTSRAGDTTWQPVIGGRDVPAGRFGHARAVLAGDRSPVLRLALPPQRADLRDGFAVRCDLLLERRSAGALLRLGRSLDVVLDDAARVRVRLVPRSTVGQTAATVNLLTEQALPTGRWCSFEIGADGSSVWCAIDGRTSARAALQGELQQSPEDVLEVLPHDQQLSATVDELQLFAYVFLPPATLPMDVEPSTTVRIAFDALGEPYAPQPIRLVIHREQRTLEFRVGPGGVLLP